MDPIEKAFNRACRYYARRIGCAPEAIARAYDGDPAQNCDPATLIRWHGRNRLQDYCDVAVNSAFLFMFSGIVLSLPGAVAALPPQENMLADPNFWGRMTSMIGALLATISYGMPRDPTLEIRDATEDVAMRVAPGSTGP